MIHGIGTDILEIAKLSPIFSKQDYLCDPFLKKTYTNSEITLAEERPLPLYFYATRFCGKEAVFKALGVDGNALRLKEIEILSRPDGSPYVILHGNAKRAAQEKGAGNIHVSLSYEERYAIAYALAEKENGRNQAPH